MGSFAERSFGSKFGTLNKIQQSRALATFYIREIHNRLKTEISDEDLELAIVDGGNDIGIDFIHRDDGQVLIIQAKYRSAGSKEPANEISHFQSVLKRICDGSIKINDRLADQVSGIDFKNDSFNLLYLTLGSQPTRFSKTRSRSPDQPLFFSMIRTRVDTIRYSEMVLRNGRGCPTTILN